MDGCMGACMHACMLWMDVSMYGWMCDAWMHVCVLDVCMRPHQNEASTPALTHHRTKRKHEASSSGSGRRSTSTPLWNATHQSLATATPTFSAPRHFAPNSGHHARGPLASTPNIEYPHTRTESPDTGRRRSGASLNVFTLAHPQSALSPGFERQADWENSSCDESSVGGGSPIRTGP